MQKKIIYNISILIILISILSLEASGRYILTGGPCVGKSTLIAKFKELGYQVAPEAWAYLFEQKKLLGTQEQMFKDPVGTRKELLDVQLDHEDKFDNEKLTFVDRSAWEFVYYGKYYNIETDPNLIELALKQKYDAVFFLDPLPEECFKTTDVRRETIEEATNIHDMLIISYLYSGIKIVKVPFDTVENRIKLILAKTIELAQMFINKY